MANTSTTEETVEVTFSSDNEEAVFEPDPVEVTVPGKNSAKQPKPAVKRQIVPIEVDEFAEGEANLVARVGDKESAPCLIKIKPAKVR